MQTVMRLAIWILAVLAFGGCAATYPLLKRSSIPNPPPQKVRILVKDFKDLTGHYDRIGVKIEDLLRSRLQAESVRVIENIVMESRARAEMAQVANIYAPSGAVEDIGDNIDLVLVGSVEEIFFGPRGFDSGAFAAFGLLGVAATEDNRVGRIALRVTITDHKTSETLFSQTVDSVISVGDKDRTETLQMAASAVATKVLSYLLEKR